MVDELLREKKRHNVARIRTLTLGGGKYVHIARLKHSIKGKRGRRKLWVHGTVRTRKRHRR